MIERIIKAVYILTIAMVVFLGGLLITKGIHITQKEAVQAAGMTSRQSIVDSQEGNAL